MINYEWLLAKLYKRRKPGKNLKKPLKHNPNLKGAYGQTPSTIIKKRTRKSSKPTRKLELRSYSLSY